MKNTFQSLAIYLIDKLAILSSSSSNYRCVIAIGGVPGSGKTTLADEVCHLVNEYSKTDVAIIVPMDGFHYYRHELDKMPNPEEAHERRGSPWTFNGELFYRKILEIKQNPIVKVPSFEHHIGDPIEDAITVEEYHKIVLVPGNYVLVNDVFMDNGIWEKISREFTEKWFIDVDISVAMEGVVKRHMKAWNWTESRARERVLQNDKPNADIIVASKANADKIVKFVYDNSL